MTRSEDFPREEDLPYDGQALDPIGPRTEVDPTPLRITGADTARTSAMIVRQAVEDDD